jgi:hypothetical protein
MPGFALPYNLIPSRIANSTRSDRLPNRLRSARAAYRRSRAAAEAAPMFADDRAVLADRDGIGPRVRLWPA